MKKLLCLFIATCATMIMAGVIENLMPRPKEVKPLEGTWAVKSSMPFCVFIELSEESAAGKPRGYYELTIRPTGLQVFYADEEGLRYGRVTAQQIMALARLEKQKTIPCVQIIDYPSYQIRGLLFDTGRNWLPIEMLRREMDLLAKYKFNVFQWHITDNHGWRLQSKKYPQLSKPENLDRTDNYYTQKDFQNIIAYAHKLGITVIPELDVPGHTMTFRRAFGLKRMDDPKVKQIVSELFDEMMDLLDPEVTPYIHIGSDEVQAHERVPDQWIVDWVNQIEARGFKVIAWGPGQYPKGLKQPLIRQYWMGRHVKRPNNEPYIDSQSSYYINHVDALELLTQACFQQPCLTGPKENRLGAIFAVWHDDALGKPEDLFTMNPVLPSTVLYADNFWNGREKDVMQWYGNLPPPEHPDFAFAEELERRTLAHRALFEALPKHAQNAQTYFPFYKQTDMRWRMAETAEEKPFNEMLWGERIIAQGTIYAQHFFFSQTNLTDGETGTVWFGMIVNSDRDQEVELIADFMNFSRSDNRKRDAALVQGKWNAKGAELRINGQTIPPPKWKQPGGGGPNIGEKPLVDEPWTARPPLKVRLKKGRNEVLVKLPLKGWKKSFTCFFPDAKGLTYEAP